MPERITLAPRLTRQQVSRELGVTPKTVKAIGPARAS